MSEQFIIEWLRQIYLPSMENNPNRLRYSSGQRVNVPSHLQQLNSEGVLHPENFGHRIPTETNSERPSLEELLETIINQQRQPVNANIWTPQNRTQSEEPRNGIPNYRYSTASQSPNNNMSHQRPVLFPEFDELMYLYHRNVQEYQYTIQDMTERMEINPRRNTRQQHSILDNLVYPYHRNMQEYNQVTLRCLDVLQTLSTTQNRTNTPIHNNNVTNEFVPPVVNNDASTTFTASSPNATVLRTSTLGSNTTFRPVQMSRPVEFEFTLFPGTNVPNIVPRNINSSTTNAHTLLTPEQIARTTREYVFQENNRNLFPSAPICPIMLEEFQVGNNIRQIIHCGHHFLSSSLNRWFRRSSCCPVCRYNLWDVSAQEPQSFTGRASTYNSDRRANSIGEERSVPVQEQITNNIISRTLTDMSIMPISHDNELSSRQTSALINSYFSGQYPLDRDIQRTASVPRTLVDISNNNNIVNEERTETSEEDTPFLDFQSSNMEGAETSIRNWISSFINSNQPGMFPNMDLDISYTVEYDYPVDSSGQMA